MNANFELAAIRRKLSHCAMKWTPSLWLDFKKYLGDVMGTMLNTVLGHTDKGMPYGRIVEISGWESNCKTAVALTLAACAQHDGAHVIWGDIENSFEPDWAIMRGMAKCPKCLNDPVKRDSCKTCDGQGIDVDRITLIQPYVGTFTYVNKQGKSVQEKEPRQSTGQELMEEVEACMKLPRKVKKTFVVIDSAAAILTEDEGDAGISGAKMNTNMSLAMFLGRLLRRWVGLAQSHNALIVFINQLREGPVKFGDPVKTVGGNALRFYSHVRVRVSRVSGSKIVDKGKTLGIKGVIKAKKNKCGGNEGAECGFRLWFYKPLVEFVNPKELTSKEE
jgi:recombination protein RecA